MTEEEFLEGVIFAQLTPGPNFSNLATFSGGRRWGSAGALAASAGMFGLPLLITLVIREPGLR